MATDHEPRNGTVSERAAARLDGEIPTCRRCGSGLPTHAENERVIADRCPTCGFDPVSDHRSKMRFWGVVTGLLCFSVVGLPFALFTGIAAYRHKREIRRGLTE